MSLLQTTVETAAAVVGVNDPGPSSAAVVLLPVGAATVSVTAFVGDSFAEEQVGEMLIHDWALEKVCPTRL